MPDCQTKFIYFAERAQMPIHSEADKASKEVKKAGKLLRYSKQFGSSGDEGNKIREIMKTKFVGSVWPQDSFAALTVGH